MADVLIVDDCAATALTTKWHLEQRGARVDAAQSLPAGLKILSKAPGDYRIAIVSGDLTLTKCSDAAKKLQDVAPQVLCFVPRATPLCFSPLSILCFLRSVVHTLALSERHPVPRASQQGLTSGSCYQIPSLTSLCLRALAHACS